MRLTRVMQPQYIQCIEFKVLPFSHLINTPSISQNLPCAYRTRNICLDEEIFNAASTAGILITATGGAIR